MDLKEIKNLITLVEKANISSFTIEESEVKIEIKKEKAQIGIMPSTQEVVPQVAVSLPQNRAPQAQVSQPQSQFDSQATTQDDFCYITSPMVGTFYTAPSPDADPFVKVGDQVEKGSVLCIVEAMKLFNEIESEFSGIIEKVLIKSGDPVEYGQKLFAIKSL